MYVMLTILLCGLLIGVNAWFVWWCMGSPVGKSGYPGGGYVVMGRIFSFYGAWVLGKFDAWEQAENERLAVFYRAGTRLIESHYDAVAREQNNKLTQDQIDKKINKIMQVNTKKEQRRRANPWKIAGTCLACFATWYGFACFAVLVYFCIIPISPLLFLAIGLPATFAGITNTLLT